AERVQIVPGGASFGRRGVLQVIPAKLQVFDFTALRFGFRRNIADRFTEGERLDLLAVNNAAVQPNIVDAAAEPPLRTASSADSERLFESLSRIVERAIQIILFNLVR